MNYNGDGVDFLIQSYEVPNNLSYFSFNYYGIIFIIIGIVFIFNRKKYYF